MTRQLALDDASLPRLAPFLLALAAAVPLLPNGYLVHVGVLVLVYVILAMGLSIVVGLAGLLDLGYVAFYAVGAYTYALLDTRAGVGFWPCLVLGSLAAAVVGVGLGLPTLRASGDYLALVTLGLGEIVRVLLLNWDAATNGPRGIMGIRPPRVPGAVIDSPGEYYWLALALAAAATTLTYRIRFSRAGIALRAIRDNESAAAALGHAPVFWKLFAFGTGAALAGAAGVFFAAWQRFVSPNSFTLIESVLVLSIVVLAGYGNLLRILTSAAFFVVVPELLRDLAEARLLLYGAVLILVVVAQERARLRRRPIPDHPPGAPAAERASRAAAPVRPAPPSRSASAGPPVLVVEGLRKRFGGIVALDGVGFEVREGELVGLLGPNGAGKTTLFHCLAGALRPDAGAVRVAGAAVPPLPWRAARLGIARTFQDVRAFDTLSPLENVMAGIHEPALRIAGRALFGSLPRERRRLMEEALRYLDLLGVADARRPVGELPLVVQKRVALAQALALRPRVLLLDEPAAGMVPAEREELLQLLVYLRGETPLTVLLVEHDPQFVLALADRILVLDRGVLIADGPPARIQADRRVQSLYLGEAYEAVCSG